MDKVQDSSLLPVNVERKISLVGKHLNLFQVMYSMNFLLDVKT